jgi:hypothetical protein
VGVFVVATRYHFFQKIRVFVVLRLACLSKSALAALLVTSYIAVLGLMGLAGGFIADRLSSNVSKSATKLTVLQRPESRVERWLKAQTVSYAVADVRALDVATPDVVGSGRDIPPAAALAAAMDRSERGVAAEVAVVEPVIPRIIDPVHERSNFTDACRNGTCESVAKARIAAKVRGAKKPLQVARLNGTTKRGSSTSVATLAPYDGKMGLGLKPSFGSAKAAAKSPFKTLRNLRLAETPAEIIHRSLRGTS